MYSVSFVDGLNQVGAVFCRFSWAMLVQSSVLILVLYGVDLLIRSRVRAVVRYGMWMLVLVKLVLPPSLSLPTGIGYWVPAAPPSQVMGLVESPPVSQVVPGDALVTGGSSATVGTTLQRPTQPTQVAQGTHAVGVAIGVDKVSALTWQAWVLFAWGAGVIGILMLLFQRLVFVHRLLSQSRPADSSWQALVCTCKTQVGIRRSVQVRVSDSLHSPAACGLVRPVILMPESIEHTLDQERLRAVLLHELVHIRRGDLWGNLVQTLLQVVYFHHPLLWLANTFIRNLREKAVDETVLTKLGQDEAGQYSTTLIDIAEVAFSKPHFSLGLIGVVESKKALGARINHILGRPVPRSAKIGLFGVAAIGVAGCLLLPMARGDAYSDSEAIITDAPSHESEKDVGRLRFPDRVILRSVTGERSETLLRQIRRFEQAREGVDGRNGTLAKGRIEESVRVFTDLSRLTDAFPVNLYAQRWLILLDWAGGNLDAMRAADRMNALAEAQSDAAQSNFTRAYAAVVLARDGYLDRAHDIFVTCVPDETPQWGWFVFEMNKYLSNSVKDRAPHVSRMIKGRGTQIARTGAQWQVIERPLREAQSAYADYLEYELLPAFVQVINRRHVRQYAEIERLQCVDVLRTLWMKDLSSFSHGATTKPIENRIRVRVRPKILAVWYESLQLMESNHAGHMAPEVQGYRQEIKALCDKSGLSMDELPMWFEQVSTDASRASDDVTATWAESGKMPRTDRVNLVLKKPTSTELRAINRLIKRLKSSDEAVWQDAAKELSAMGPIVAEPLTDLFRKGGDDIKAVNILKSMASTEQVQAAMVSTLEYNRALNSNASHCALIVLAESGNQAHVPRIVRFLKEGIASRREPTMEAIALGQLGGDQAYDTLCDIIVRDISPTLRWIVAEQLVKFENPEAIVCLEKAAHALGTHDDDMGPRRRVIHCIYQLTGGSTSTLWEFTVPVYDRNVPNFSQYIGANLSQFNSSYVNLKRFGLEVGVSPEVLFNKHDQCAFYMKAGHELICIRGTKIAPITLPDVDPDKNWGWTDRLGLLYPNQILRQIEAHQDTQGGQSSMSLKDGALYAVVTPGRHLLVMRATFGRYESGAEATTLTCVKLAESVQWNRPAHSSLLAPGFNIYLLEDETLTWDDCREVPLHGLALRSEPWIRASDILRYDASTHCMTLKQTRPLPFERVSLRGNPFMVTVGDDRCYLGAVWTHLSSYLPDGVTPRINMPNFSFAPNVVGIELLRVESRGGYLSSLDVRSDSRVLSALKAQGVAHGGLSLDLEPITIVADGQESSVIYSYTLTNQDSDPLYVFDPDKMGSALFHCFHNAPSLFHPQAPHRIERHSNVAVDRDLYNQYRKDWFTLIMPGESLSRTVAATGYPLMSPGSYECGFAFRGPGTGFTEDKQAQFDAPVWMGQIHVRNTLIVSEARLDEAAGNAISEIIENTFPASPGNGHFAVEQCDERPTVKVGTLAGYRVVCSWQRPVLSNVTQSSSDLLFAAEHVELIVFAHHRGQVEISPGDLPWSEFDAAYHVQPVDMGYGHDHRWFGKMPLWLQDDFRGQLDLEGGEDRARLAAAGLAITDQGQCTANSMVQRMRRYGDRGVEVIAEALASHRHEDPWYIVLGLSTIETPASTALLVELYGSQDQRTSDAAAYALIHKPLRPGARRTYLDMLAHRVIYWVQIAEGFADNGWQEGLGTIQSIYLEEAGTGAALSLLKSARILEQKPLSAELLDAFDLVKTLTHLQIDTRPSESDIRTAQKTIVTSADKEAAALMGVDIALGLSKGNNNQAHMERIGLEILSQLPRDRVNAVLNRLLSNVGDNAGYNSYRKRLTTLLTDVNRAQENQSGAERS